MSMSVAQAAIMEAVASRVIGGNKALYVLPYFMGGYLDSLMMGIVICQLITYSRFVRTDKKHIVATVVAVAILTSIASIMILLWTIELYIWDFGTYVGFLGLKWVVRYVSVEVATVLVVQAFYITRSCLLWKHYWPAILMGPCCLITAVVGSAAIRTMDYRYPMIDQNMTDDPVVKVLAYTWLGFILLTDTLITVIIALGLYRIKTGFTATDTKLRRLLVRCFETQTPALVSSFVSLIMWNKRFEVVLAFIMLQSKVFSLGLLITLNLRAGAGPQEVHVSHYSSASQGKSNATYPPDLSSTDDSQLAQLDKNSWRFSELRPPPGDIELGSLEAEADTEGKPYGSTTALRRPA